MRKAASLKSGFPAQLPANPALGLVFAPTKGFTGGIPICMGSPNRLPDEEPDEVPQEHFETFEGRRIDSRFSTSVDPHRDVRFDTHVNPRAVVPQKPGATLLILLAVAGILTLAIVSYFLFLGSNKQDPRTPGAPTGQMQQAPVRPLAPEALLPLARLRENEKKQRLQEIAYAD